jgi:hypothetical protein
MDGPQDTLEALDIALWTFELRDYHPFHVSDN